MFDRSKGKSVWTKSGGELVKAEYWGVELEADKVTYDEKQSVISVRGLRLWHEGELVQAEWADLRTKPGNIVVLSTHKVVEEVNEEGAVEPRIELETMSFYLGHAK